MRKPLGLLLLAVAVLAGLFSGPMVLASAAASEPPLRWVDLQAMAGFMLVAPSVVLGFQVLLGNIKALRLGWAIFFYIAICFASAGLVAAVIAWRDAGLAPHALLYLVLGVSTLGGLGLTRLAFRRHLAPR